MSSANRGSLTTVAITVLVVMTVLSSQMLAFVPMGMLGSPTPVVVGTDETAATPSAVAQPDTQTDTTERPGSSGVDNDPSVSKDRGDVPQSPGDPAADKRSKSYKEQAADNPVLNRDTPPVSELPEPKYTTDVVDSGSVIEVDLTTGDVTTSERPSDGSVEAPDSTLTPDGDLSAQSNDIEPQAINGDDGRVIVGDTTEYPYRMTTQLIIQFDSNYYLCSGAMVSSYHVLTSAHCVAQFNDYADNVTVYPGRDGSFAPYGEAHATNIRIYESWETSEPVSYDFALLTLDKNIGKNTGWFGYATFPATDSRYFDSIEFAGYPGDKGSGNEMYNQTGQGIYVDQFYPSTHWYTMDSVGGQSGSGVWYYDSNDEPRLLSVHGYGSSPYNLGIRIDSEKYNDLNNWIASDTPPESYVQIVDDGNQWFGLSPDPLTPGETFTVESDVRNIGTENAGSYTVTYFLSTDRTLSSDDYQFAQVSDGPLASLDYADVSYTGTFPSVPAGAYYVIRSTDGSISALTTESTTDGTTGDSVVATDTTVTVGEALTSTVTADIVVPAEGEFLANTGVAVSGTATSDNGVVQTVEVSDDGGASWAQASITNNSWSYTYSAAGDGDYSLLVRATDDIGTEATDTVNFSVDTTAPLVGILSPTASSPVNVDPSESVFVDVEYSETNPDEFIVSLTKDGSVLVSETSVGAASGFNTITTELVIPADAPAGDYDVTVTAVDKAGNSVSRTETAAVSVVSEAPSIDSVSVSPQLVGPGDQLTVSVTASDDQSVTSVTAGGVALTQQSDGSWTGTVTAATTDGPQSLSIEATDGDGQTATTSATYEVDASAPTFDSVSLNPTVVAGGDPVTVTVFVTDANGIDSVTADGVSLTQQADGSWTGTIPAEPTEGINGVSLVATDTLGNSDATSAVYTVDNTAPSVSLSAPAESASASVTVTGAVSDANGVSSVVLAVNGNAQSVTLASDGSFTTTVTLVEGANTLELTAADNAGNEASASAQTTVDTTAPNLTVNAPAQTTSSDVVVSGTATDANGIDSLTVSVDGGAAQPVAIAADGSYSVTLSLADGPHQIVVTATDSFGNSDADAVSVEVDSVAPAVSLTAPATSDTTEVTVSGSATDNSGLQTVELVVNGVATPVSLDSNGDFTTTVSLNEGDNTLVLRATDTFGNTAQTSTTTTVDLDTDAPSVTLNAPGTTASADVTVTGTVSDESAISAVNIAVNGGAAQPVSLASDGSYSATVSLSEGQNTITVTATDEFGNAASQSASVLVDTSVPSLSLSAPATSDSTAVTVTGSATDSNGVDTAELLVNGNAQTLSLDSNGDFSVTVSLAEGDNTLVLRATDSLGNTASASTTTSVDTTAPALSLNAPASADTTSVDVSGSVTDANGLQTVELVVNGDAQPVSVASDGSFAETLTLVEGENTIVLRAVDSFGNDAQTSATTTVTLDTDAPVVTVSAPSASNDATVTVSGTVTDESAVSTAELVVNGNAQPLSLAADGSYSVAVTLNEGENTIEVRATDEFGNSGSASATTAVDTAAPSLSLSAPSNTNDASFEVTGAVTDANDIATAELIVNGNAQTLSLAPDGSFAVTVALQEGENTVALRAVDSFNNENTAQTTVTYTPLEDLSVSVSTLEDPTADTIVAVSGSIQNAVGDVTVQVESPVDSNSVTISAGETTYRLPVQLAHGENTVTVTVTDAEGRTATAQTTTTVDSKDPSINSISLNETTVFPGESILVTVDASDDTTSVAGVTANNLPLSQNADGTWSGVLNAPATAGDYSVLVVATDEVGNTAGSSTAYTVAPKPDLALSVDALPSLLGEQSATISGEVANAVGEVTVTVDSPAETKMLTLSQNGPFSTDVALMEGSNTVTVTATDTDGRTVTKTVSTTVDTTAPAVALNAPATSDSTDVDVSGSVSDASGLQTVELLVNGDAAPVTLDSNGDFTTTVSMVEGENTVTLRAVDAAGNAAQTSATTTVTLDTDAPVVTVNAPAETNTSEVTITGSVADESTVNTVDLTVGGETDAVPVAADGSFKTSLTLADGQYTITASATDEFGNTGSASTSVLVDTTAPAVNLNAPATSDSTEVAVSGTVSDSVELGSVELLVNGDAAPVTLDAQGTFETTVTLQEGENTLVLRATDGVGNENSASATTTVTLDGEAPTLSLSAPELSASSDVLVTGSVTDASGIESASIYVNDEFQTDVTLVEGAFETTLSLAEGENSIELRATDTQGNTATTSTTTVVDTTGPSVSLNAPATSESTDVGISGTVTDALTGISQASLYVNGDYVGDLTLGSDGSYSTTVTLVEGENTIEVRALDGLENFGSASATTTVALDNEAPTLTLNVPAESGSTTVEISGSATDASGLASVELGVNGQAVPIQVTDGAFTTTIEVDEGINRVTLRATDTAGNTAVLTEKLRVDTTAPVVTLDVPETSDSTDVAVSGTVTDASSPTADLLVNGEVVESYSGVDGTISTTVSLNEGENTVTLRAVDAFGNEAEVTKTVVVELDEGDTAAPTIVIDAPAVTNADPVDVTVRFSDESTITGFNFEVGDTTAPTRESTSGEVTYSLSLDEGVTTVTATATDEFGNTATVSKDILVDRTAPEYDGMSSDDSPGNSLTFDAGSTPTVKVQGADSLTNVTSVTVDGTPLQFNATNGLWEGQVEVRSEIGREVFVIRMADDAGNVLEYAQKYTVRAAPKQPTGDINEVSPVLECVFPHEDRYVAVFGYENRNDVTVTQSTDERNYFYGGPRDLGQPTEFDTGRHHAVFAVEFGGGNLVWTLGDSTSTASENSKKCGYGIKKKFGYGDKPDPSERKGGSDDTPADGNNEAPTRDDEDEPAEVEHGEDAEEAQDDAEASDDTDSTEEPDSEPDDASNESVEDTSDADAPATNESVSDSTPEETQEKTPTGDEGDDSMNVDDGVDDEAPTRDEEEEPAEVEDGSEEEAAQDEPESGVADDSVNDNSDSGTDEPAEN